MSYDYIVLDGCRDMGIFVVLTVWSSQKKNQNKNVKDTFKRKLKVITKTGIRFSYLKNLQA